MQPMNPRGPPPPCKFGPNCKNLAQGTCRFSHQTTMQGQNPNQNVFGPKHGGQRGPTNYPPQNYGPGNQPNMYQGGGGSGFGNQPYSYNKNFN